MPMVQRKCTHDIRSKHRNTENGRTTCGLPGIYLVLHEYVPGTNDDVEFPVPTEVPVYQGQATEKQYVTYPDVPVVWYYLFYRTYVHILIIVPENYWRFHQGWSLYSIRVNA